jgi:hypothetical protein
MKGRMYSFYIEPGFAQDVFEEYYYIWIDFNQDGAFENETELVYSTAAPRFGPVSGSFVIPPEVEEGSTRMRVMMLFSPEQDTVSGCNTLIELGEAEDYCVTILPNDLTCFQTAEIDTMNLMPGSVEIVWAMVDSAIGYTYRYRMLGSEEWEELVDTARTYTIEGLEACTQYEFQVRSVCIYDTSTYTESFIFLSFCQTSAQDVPDRITVDVFPNPFQDYLNIGITVADGGKAQFGLYDLQGRSVFKKFIPVLSNNRYLMTEQLGYLPPGIYFAQIYINGNVATKKLIKQ